MRRALFLWAAVNPENWRQDEVLDNTFNILNFPTMIVWQNGFCGFWNWKSQENKHKKKEKCDMHPYVVFDECMS